MTPTPTPTAPAPAPARFERGRAMLLAGLRQHHRAADGPRDIPAQWQRFIAFGPLPGQCGDAAYGAECDRRDGGFDYLCAVEVERVDGLPDGIVGLPVEPQLHAVFEHRGHVSSLHATWQAAYAWLRTSTTHRAADGPDFEVYGPGFDPRTGLGDMTLRIAVEPVAGDGAAVGHDPVDGPVRSDEITGAPHAASRRRFFGPLLSLVAVLSVGSRACFAADAAVVVPEGKGTFTFIDVRGDPSRHVAVYTYLPHGVDPATARIVFVMHGVTKDAEGYRDTWIPLADRDGFLIVAPLFDAARWGGGAYSHGNLADRDGKPLDRSLWSFSVIEHLFDAVASAVGNGAPRYDLYGHSEGGQFVHRLVLTLPDARYARAIAANAGWYTMPQFDVDVPFGLHGAPVDASSLKRSLGRDLVVLLGDRDIDPHHPQLNRSAAAMAQGTNRFERGHRFFAAAGDAAKALDVPLGWRLQVVHGAAHQNSRMSRAAADLLDAP